VPLGGPWSPSWAGLRGLGWLLGGSWVPLERPKWVPGGLWVAQAWS
jgi:hypothetical protein